MKVQNQLVKKYLRLRAIVVEEVSCACFRPDIHLEEVLKSCGSGELRVLWSYVPSG